MESKHKNLWLNHILPFVYTVGTVSVCLFVSGEIRKYLNLFLSFDSGLFLFPCLLFYFAFMWGASKNYLVAKTRIRTYFCGMSAFAILYLFLTLAPMELLRALILRLTGRPELRGPLLFLTVTASFILVLVLMAAAMHQVTKIRVVRDEVPLENFCGDPVHLVLLSDLHIGYYVGVPFIRKVTELVNELHPDLVVIAGDLVNAGNTRECDRIDEAADLLASLKTRLGVFAVTGNHDPYQEDPEFQAFLKRARIRLLDHEIFSCDSFDLAGRGTRTRERPDLAAILAGRDSGRPLIVTDHDPLGINEAVQEGADLVLCGHTHKGQIFPLNFFVRLLYKKDEFWGHGMRGKTHLIVSAGTGFFSMPMRLGSSCEIRDIRLCEKKKER